MSWTESHGFSTFRGYNLTLLGVDDAYLNITNLLRETIWVYQRSKDCFECPFINVKDWEYKNIEILPGASWIDIVSTKFPTVYRLYKNEDLPFRPENDTQFMQCELSQEPRMGEFGIYEATIQENGGCDFKEVLEPVSIYLPFLTPIFFYLCLAILLFAFNKYKSALCKLLPFCNNDSSGTQAATAESERAAGGGSVNKPPAAPAAPARTRLRSLDTFRGICIMIMIFVNDGGAGYSFLEHATWDGLYVADLVFPWFLWIMGVCIPVSIKSQVKRNTPKLTILRRIVVRSLKLIAIGVMLNSKGGPIEFSTLRLPGVLQRFGICYFIGATSVLLCSSNDFVNNRKADNKYVALVQDIAFIWKGWLISIASVILHTCLTFFLEVPGCPTGYLGPGGLHKNAAYGKDCIGGAAGYIDRQILTVKHLYQWPTAGATYDSSAYDPEGILGTLTSVMTVWLGVQAGLTLQVYPKHRSRLIRWGIWAVICGGLGAALCFGKETGGPIPLNKNLWSLSFVLVLSCFALILLMALYVTIDMFKVWSGTPFFEPGMNSILLYVGHSVANEMLPWHFRLKSMNTHFKRLIESLWGTSMWALYAIYLYHKKFFWSL